jgi:hypothetical protein
MTVPKFGPAHGAWIMACMMCDPRRAEIERAELREVRRRLLIEAART